MSKIITILFLGAIMNLSANEPKLPESSKLIFNPPMVNPIETENGLKIYAQSDKTLPIIHLTAIIKTGKVYDPKEKIGLNELLMESLRDGGTLKYKSDEIDKKLEYLGASIDTSINYEEARVNLTCLKKDFDTVFDIFFDIISNPAFEEDKFNLKKEEMIEMIRRRNDKPDIEARREALRMFYGPEHPYGWRTEIDTVNSITIDDLKKYHKNFFKPNNIIIATAGDFDEKEILNKISEKFSSLKKETVVFPEIPEVKIEKEKKIYLIDKPLSQSFIVFLMEGLKRHDDREYSLSVLSEYMGGGIQSKLGREIRSKRGLAYSVYSYPAKRNKSGFIQTYVGTKPQSVNEAITEVLRNMNEAKTSPIPEEDLNEAKSQIINSFVFMFPTTFDIVNERASYDYYDYPKNYLDNYVKNIDAVDKNKVQDIAKQLYNTEKPLIFVLGDKSKFQEPLSKFGEVNELKED